MYELIIYGASDDLIEIEGCIQEEFSYYFDEPPVIAISDGTLLRSRYDEDGIWRFTPIIIGPETVIDFKVGQDDEQHSDNLTLTSPNPFTWVVIGDQSAR